MKEKAYTSISSHSNDYYRGHRKQRESRPGSGMAGRYSSATQKAYRRKRLHMDNSVNCYSSDEDDEINVLRETLLHSIRESKTRSKEGRKYDEKREQIFDTDIDDLEALRQAALCTVKPSSNSTRSLPVLSSAKSQQFPCAPCHPGRRLLAHHIPFENCLQLTSPKSNLIVLTDIHTKTAQCSVGDNDQRQDFAPDESDQSLRWRIDDKKSDQSDDDWQVNELRSEAGDSASNHSDTLVITESKEPNNVHSEQKTNNSEKEEVKGNVSRSMKKSKEEEEMGYLEDQIMADLDNLLYGEVDDEAMLAAAAVQDDVDDRGPEIIISDPPTDEITRQKRRHSKLVASRHHKRDSGSRRKRQKHSLDTKEGTEYEHPEYERSATTDRGRPQSVVVCTKRAGMGLIESSKKKKKKDQLRVAVQCERIKLTTKQQVNRLLKAYVPSTEHILPATSPAVSCSLHRQADDLRYRLLNSKKAIEPMASSGKEWPNEREEDDLACGQERRPSQAPDKTVVSRPLLDFRAIGINGKWTDWRQAEIHRFRGRSSVAK